MPEIQCPACSQMLDLDAGTGSRITCPICATTFDWRPGAAATIAPAAAPAAASLSAAAPSLSDAPWHLTLPDGTRYGPSSATEICGWIREGRIPNGSMVWRSGFAGWQVAEATEPFSAFFSSTPGVASGGAAGYASPALQRYNARSGYASGERWSGLAIAGFVISLVAGCLAPLSLIFCIVALNATSRDPRLRGRGFAIAGLIISIISIILIVFWIVLLTSTIRHPANYR